MDGADGKSHALRELAEEHPEIGSDLAALFGFDLEAALWLDQTPSVVRRAELLIARLAFHKRDSLYTARRIKEATLERKELRAAERAEAVAAGADPEAYDEEVRARDIAEANEQLTADPFEYFGWDAGLYKLAELVDAINLVQRQIVAVLAGGADLPAFAPSYRPGDQLGLPDAHNGAQILDLEDFDPAALGL